MRKLALLFCASLLCAPAFCQEATNDPAKNAKIEKLFTSMNIDKQMDAMFGQMKSMIMSQLPASTTAEQKAKVTDVQNKIFDLMQQRMSWEKMRPTYIKMYAETFTASEVDGLVAFYDSPAGKAMLAKMPLLMQKSMGMAQDLMKDIMPQIQQITKDAAADQPAPK